MHLSGLVAASNGEPRHAGDRLARLDVERPAARQSIGGDRQQFQPADIGKRRIEKDDVEAARFVFQECIRVGAMRFETGCTQLCGGSVERAHEHAVAVNGHCQSGATRERFECERAAAGERVEDRCAAQILPEPIEQRLADTVRRWPHALVRRKVQPSPAPLPADDADLVGEAQGTYGLETGLEGKIIASLLTRLDVALFKRASDTATPSWAERLKSGLSVTRERLVRPLASAFTQKAPSQQTLEELESALISADVGVDATAHLLADMEQRRKRSNSDDPREALKASLRALLAPLESPLEIGTERPFVIMVAGVNGTGKTTSIGKLAKYLQVQGHSVLLAAGDTFRAARSTE